MRLEQDGKNVASNVMLPNYKYNTKLMYFVEADPPPESIYMPVGYNDLPTIKEFMGLTDSKGNAVQ